jgi:PAS domain S-box-containing protein
MNVARSDETGKMSESPVETPSVDLTSADLSASSTSGKGVRIVVLSRLFVLTLVLMTFSIVGITLMNVDAGDNVVGQWRDFEQGISTKQSASFRLDLAGLINSFQVYTGQPNDVNRQAVLGKAAGVRRIIEIYNTTPLSEAEASALQTIQRAIDHYQSVLTGAVPGSGNPASSPGNQLLFANTNNAIEAAISLNAELETQREAGFSKMQSSIDGMMSVLYIIAISSSFVAAAAGSLIWWLSNRLLVNPLVALRMGMEKLAAGDTSISMGQNELLTDIRDMTSSVEVFRRNLLEAERLRREDRETQRQIQILSQAIEQSQVSVVLLDPEKRIEYFNPRFCEVHDCLPEEIMGKSFGSVFSPDPNLFDLETIWSEFAERNGWQGEVPGLDIHGQPVWQHLVVSPVRSDDGSTVSHYLVVMEDVSNRKEIETRLIEAKENAEVANRSKTEFLANMTHELRTPLNAIIGFSEIIKGELLGPIEQKSYVEYSNDIFESGRHLLGLIEDILDFSKIEVGRQELVEEDVDLSAAIELSCNIVSERARRQNISIVRELPGKDIFIRADDRKVKQILLNLLSNAIKFSHEGGAVRTGVRIEDNRDVAIYIQDYGIGISEEDISIALTPFGQVDSNLNRNYEGTGLGLPLSRSLAEGHGGSLAIESEQNVGTTVTVRFPATRNLVIGEIRNIADCA